jgi:predicted PolB exonuclease-like 3'-5' exonuclease
MFRTVKDHVWAFDLEWVPDPMAGRLLHKLPDRMSDREVMMVMWEQANPTPENPMPFLRTILCRVVSIAAVVRKVKPDGEVKLDLVSLPRDTMDVEQAKEANLISRFLHAIGKGNESPQLVGYNSQAADLKILLQRGFVLGIEAAAYCKRPEKPWDGRDYFARESEWNIDMCNILGGYGRGGSSAVSLHQAAVLSGIPGKMDVDGNQVAGMWLDGKLDKIVQYNEYDALTTYLVWLRLAHFGCLFDDEQYEIENQRVRTLLANEIENKGKLHLQAYVDEWNRLQSILNPVPVAV